MRKSGFSLLEMMTVVAVVGILTTVAGFSIQRAVANQRANTGIREIYGVVLQARNKARAANTPVRFNFVDAGSGRVGMRWERLACGDRWGNNCPAPTCTGTTGNCTDMGGTCPCAEAGPVIALPTEVDTSADAGFINDLDGLCFTAGSGAPRRRPPLYPEFLTCTAGTPLNGSNSVFNIKGTTNPEATSLHLEPATGFPRLIDCSKVPTDPLCP